MLLYYEGLRADHHGIVGNYFYDRESGKEFSLTRVNRPGDASRDPIWWEQHVPLWISATEEGLRTSLYLWSLCDVPFNGVLPEKCSPYDLLPCLSINAFGDNLDQAAQDLRDGFDLTMVYYGNVDEMGHIHGPESAQVDDEVMAVDFWIGYFQDVLQVWIFFKIVYYKVHQLGVT